MNPVQNQYSALKLKAIILKSARFPNFAKQHREGALHELRQGCSPQQWQHSNATHPPPRLLLSSMLSLCHHYTHQHGSACCSLFRAMRCFSWRSASFVVRTRFRLVRFAPRCVNWFAITFCKLLLTNSSIAIRTGRGPPLLGQQYARPLVLLVLVQFLFCDSSDTTMLMPGMLIENLSSTKRTSSSRSSLTA